MSDDDDFFDEGSSRGSVSEPLVVSVPGSEASGAKDSARSISTTRSVHKTDLDDSEEESTYSEEIYTESPITSSRKGKKKVKNGTRDHGLDMTPPDKLLSRAKKKAKKYSKAKKVESALQELIRCTALARIVYGDGHWKLAETYANLAQGYFELKGFAPQAQNHAETAKMIMMSGVHTSGSSDEKAEIMQILITLYYTLGRALMAQNKCSEAEQALLKVEKISEERSKLAPVTDQEIDEWEIKIDLALARVFGKQQKQAMATSYFEKAQDVIEACDGKDSLDLIPVYQGLGKSKGRHADHEKAIENFLQAHSIASAHYSGGSIEVAETAQALAMAYSNVGDDDAETSAESYLNECLAIYQSTYGPNHVKTLEIQGELARLMVRTDRSEDAISVLRSMIEPQSEVYGEYSNETAETYKLIGSVHLSKGNGEKALRAFKKCLTIETMLHGKNNKKTKDTQRTMDILLANPSLASKQKPSKDQELKERPRFNAIVKGSKNVGGTKANVY